MEEKDELEECTERKQNTPQCLSSKNSQLRQTQKGKNKCHYKILNYCGRCVIYLNECYKSAENRESTVS